MPDPLAIYPILLRYMAEKFWLVESGHPQAQTPALTRRLLVLRDRIDLLVHGRTNQMGWVNRAGEGAPPSAF